MPKIKLTNTFIQRVVKPKKEKIRYTDTIEVNLVLEVKSNGIKCFYYKYQSQKNTTAYKKIDNFSNINLDTARAKVKELKKLDAFVNNDVKRTLECMSINEFYTNYYLPFIKTSKKSYKADMSFFNNHILPNWGIIPLNKLSKKQISDKHISMLENKLASSTANKLLKYLSYFYNLAIQWEIPNVNNNPITNIKPFKVDNLIERYLNKEEINKVLYHASQLDNSYIKPIIEVLLLTGGRRSEVLKLKWEDIDFTNMILTFTDTKSKRQRKIPISQKLESILKSLPKVSSYLFPSNRDINKHFENITYYWQIIRKKAKLNDVRIHDLRHTFASTLVNNKVPLYDVQKLLGHSSIAITQRYAHLSNESLKSAVSCAGELLGK